MAKYIFLLFTFLISCNTSLQTKNDSIPVIGILAYEGVLMTEVTAPFDVFAKHSEDGKELFKIVIVAESTDLITTEEGLRIKPDFTLDNSPHLTALFVPSAYDVSAQVKNKKLIDFIKSKGKAAKYVVSNCAGAQLIGESGIANGKKIVTWIGGGKDLQKQYPELKVQDETKVSFVEDGKFSSSNGNLATYISSLELLEKMSSKKHREFVESYLYLERLQNWKK